MKRLSRSTSRLRPYGSIDPLGVVNHQTNSRKDGYRQYLKAIGKHWDVLRSRYKVKEIGIFGSAVRGEQRKRSDVDVLVEYEVTPDLLEFISLRTLSRKDPQKKSQHSSKRGYSTRITRYHSERGCLFVKRNTTLFVKDILSCIDSIQGFLGQMNYQQFLDDDKTSTAVVHKLEIIGEATKNLPKGIRLRYPDVPWTEIAGMRDKIAHFYFGIDYQVVWNVVKQHFHVLGLSLIPLSGMSEMEGSPK